DLHFLFGFLQRTLAFTGQTDALLERLQGFFEAELSLLHGRDQLFQAGEGFLEVEHNVLLLAHEWHFRVRGRGGNYRFSGSGWRMPAALAGTVTKRSYTVPRLPG